jgi:hypothetical protein
MERAFAYLEQVEAPRRELFWENLGALLEYRRLRVHFTLSFFAAKEDELARQKKAVDSAQKRGRCVQLEAPCGICKAQVKRRDFSQLFGEQPQSFYASAGRGLCHSACYEQKHARKTTSGRTDGSV